MRSDSADNEVWLTAVWVGCILNRKWEAAFMGDISSVCSFQILSVFTVRTFSVTEQISFFPGETSPGRQLLSVWVYTHTHTHTLQPLIPTYSWTHKSRLNLFMSERIPFEWLFWAPAGGWHHFLCFSSSVGPGSPEEVVCLSATGRHSRLSQRQASVRSELNKVFKAWCFLFHSCPDFMLEELNDHRSY